MKPLDLNFYKKQMKRKDELLDVLDKMRPTLEGKDPNRRDLQDKKNDAHFRSKNIL